MPHVTVVGIGQAGLQLALGLLRFGYEVTLVADRSAEEIAGGRVLASQCMFESALQTERSLGLDFWADDAPAIEDVQLTLGATSWRAPLDWPAQSVDQRVKFPRWIDDFVARGGILVSQKPTVDVLEEQAACSDLVVAATRSLGELFAVDTTKQQRDAVEHATVIAYVRRESGIDSTLRFVLIPGAGEYASLPALSVDGPCEIMVFAGAAGGAMDCWHGADTPPELLERALELLENLLPQERERFRGAELVDANSILSTRITPTVRLPAARLASGALVLGLADAVVLNGPNIGQASNNAAKCAEIYLESIVEQGDRSFDEVWMHQTFERYWRAYARWVVSWTATLLRPPPPHVIRIVDEAERLPGLARQIVNGFDDPRRFHPWWFDPAAAATLIAEKRAEASVGLDRRELRRALGQFATGVTVVTAWDGVRDLPVGLTINSFTSLSLDPPLVLWAIGKSSRAVPAFRSAVRFAVHVLSAEQHYLSRQFATSGEEKFAGVAYSLVDGLPILGGVLACFVCQNVRQIDAGDHVIIIGEIERFENADGEPLVFHSGAYRVATRHPELDR